MVCVILRGVFTYGEYDARLHPRNDPACCPRKRVIECRPDLGDDPSGERELAQHVKVVRGKRLSVV